MEYEYYEDVIDAYEAGIGVEEGDSLTDYIRKNNIKIINIEPFRPTESKADGGSVGIEVLFGPKVPAAPSQLVSESDILLGYRGDAAYRSRSEQSKSIGQGNVGSKASFGGGQGRDRSGRSEGAGGVNPNQYTSKQQNVNQIKANLGIKDPNLLQKTFNKYNSLPIGVKAGINTMAPVELMKLFNIGNALNTGYNQIKRPVLTDEDILLEPGALPDLALGATEEISFKGNSPFMGNQINERIKAAEKKYYEQGKMPPELLGDRIRMNMELGNRRGFMGPGFEDGGRVGLFMGGSPLEGEALSIYNSMKAYGNDDQTIADRLQALGMYTPGDSTPDTPDTGIINQQLNQGRDDSGGITTLEPLTRKSNPNNFLNKAFSKIGDFTGSMMDKFSDTKVGEGITEGATKFKNIAFTPMMALMNTRNPLNPNASNYNPFLQDQMDFLEGQTGTRISGMPDNLQFTEGQMMIGRDPNSGLTKYGPGSVLSGKNVVSGFGTNDYETMLRDYLTKMEANTRISAAGKAARIAQAEAELAAEIERQRQANQRTTNQGTLDYGITRGISERDYRSIDRTRERSDRQDEGKGPAGSSTYNDPYDPGGGEKDGGFIDGYNRRKYSDGGLATMFTRRR